MRVFFICLFVGLSTVGFYPLQGGAFKSMDSREKKEKVEMGPYKVNGKAFPKHWGKPPEIQTRDFRELPGGYGMGSSTLGYWIETNLEKDKKQ